jgi:hypothetical protein
MKKTMQILTLIALAALLLGGGTSAMAQDAVAVSINAPTEVVTGSNFTASVDIASVTDFDAGQFDVSYDESMLRLDNVTSGLIDTTEIPVVLWNKISPGTYRVIVNVPGVPGVSGSGYLAVLNFHAVSSAVSSSAINITNRFINDNLGVEITATWTGDSVAVCDNLVITTTSLSDGTVGSAYSATLRATGGNGTYTWSISAGSLPPSLLLDTSTGAITGTPTTAGIYNFTAQVTDSLGAATKALSIIILPPRPSIMVTSSNGGEEWAAGSTQTITWASTGVTGNVRIQLSRNGGATWRTLVSSTPNDGTHTWTVTGPATTQARIRIVSVSHSTIRDSSDANFTIAQSITVTSPNGGENWAVGTSQTIT